MDLAIASDHHFTLDSSGHVWTPSSFTRPYWERYLGYFDRLLVVARCRRGRPEAHHRRADGPAVRFVPLDDFTGPSAYLAKARAIARAGIDAVRASHALVVRAATHVSVPMFVAAKALGRPVGVEVVGDPWDTFSRGSVVHPMRPTFRLMFAGLQRWQVGAADVALYVTARALQRRYPTHAPAYAASDAELPSSAYAPGARRWSEAPATPRLLFVGTLAQLYKGPDVLVEALARIHRTGRRATLTIVGEGGQRAPLERLAAARGVAALVRFAGQLQGGAAVARELDAADVFVLPSRQEGMPRALLEAMARALPCVSTTVGGIPELLEPEDLVERNDAPRLAAKLAEITASAERLNAMSARNLLRARAYENGISEAPRRAYLARLAELARGSRASERSAGAPRREEATL